MAASACGGVEWRRFLLFLFSFRGRRCAQRHRRRPDTAPVAHGFFRPDMRSTKTKEKKEKTRDRRNQRRRRQSGMKIIILQKKQNKPETSQLRNENDAVLPPFSTSVILLRPRTVQRNATENKRKPTQKADEVNRKKRIGRRWKNMAN